jgi:hypothetical protein
LAEFSKELTLEKSVRTNTRENKDILNSGFIYVLGAVVVRANALSISHRKAWFRGDHTGIKDGYAIFVTNPVVGLQK